MPREVGGWIKVVSCQWGYFYSFEKLGLYLGIMEIGCAIPKKPKTWCFSWKIGLFLLCVNVSHFSPCCIWCWITCSGVVLLPYPSIWVLRKIYPTAVWQLFSDLISQKKKKKTRIYVQTLHILGTSCNRSRNQSLHWWLIGNTVWILIVSL